MRDVHSSRFLIDVYALFSDVVSSDAEAYRPRLRNSRTLFAQERR